MRMDGKTIVITGAASGIGQATAIKAMSEGARVVGVDQNSDGMPDGVEPILGDVTDDDTIARAIAAAGDIHGACSFSWFSSSRYMHGCLLAFRTHPAPSFSPICLLVVAYAPDIRAASSTRGTRPSSFSCLWSRSR